MNSYKEIIKKGKKPKNIPLDYIPDAFEYAAKKGKEYYILYFLSNLHDFLSHRQILVRYETKENRIILRLLFVLEYEELL